MVGEGPEKGWTANEFPGSELFYFRPNDLRDPAAFTFPDDLSLCDLSASGFSDQSALRVLRAFVVNSPDYLI